MPVDNGKRCVSELHVRVDSKRPSSGYKSAKLRMKVSFIGTMRRLAMCGPFRGFQHLARGSWQVFEEREGRDAVGISPAGMVWWHLQWPRVTGRSVA